MAIDYSITKSYDMYFRDFYSIDRNASKSEQRASYKTDKPPIPESKIPIFIQFLFQTFYSYYKKRYCVKQYLFFLKCDCNCFFITTTINYNFYFISCFM